MNQLKFIGFDADDTLWVNEPIFTLTQQKFTELVGRYVTSGTLDERLYATEMRNLRLFGYGIKGFILSMIETAIELSERQITGAEIQQIIDLGKIMLDHPVEVLPNVEETLKALQEKYTLLLISKGDLFDQESKIARSGLADYFNHVEILSEKDETAYTRLLKRQNIPPGEFLMVGNSLKSDVLPICNIGGHAVYIPFHTTWVHEQLTAPAAGNLSYHELPAISLLPALLGA